VIAVSASIEERYFSSAGAIVIESNGSGNNLHSNIDFYFRATQIRQ